ncbi:MAG TPA: DUF1579 family protein [Gemmatales bacterium]|nr:DUF1579 family protein [Gemmatales bacterium]HMP58680.1 DUF1579 family protein [Gemmatales bacterium]
MKKVLASLMLAMAATWLLSPLAAQPPMPRPGPEQERLINHWQGNWDCTMNMMGTEGKGSAVCRPIMGGFFCQMEFKGEFMGTRFDGRSVMGYCPARKCYQSTWIDSMSPSLTIMNGKYTDDKTYVEEGEGPNMEGKLEKMKSVTTFVDADTIEMNMYKIEGEKEEKTMTLVFKRKK